MRSHVVRASSLVGTPPYHIIIYQCDIVAQGRGPVKQKIPLTKNRSGEWCVWEDYRWPPRRELRFSVIFRSESLLSEACMNCFKRASKSAGPVAWGAAERGWLGWRGG